MLLGFGLGIFPLVMVMISRSGRDTAETTALSTLAQSTGYLLATVGPFGMGLLHSATGGWTLPLVLLLAIALAQIVVAHLPHRPEDERLAAMTLSTSHRPAAGRRNHGQAPGDDPLRRVAAAAAHPVRDRTDGRPGVSRGTLREAVKALAHSGMLEVRRGDGTYVRATSEISGAARRMYQDHTQEHILEVRLGLDTQAARLAARNATADDVAAMRALLAERDVAWKAADYAGWAGADWGFHVRVAHASGNPLLHELYVSFGEVFHNDLLSSSAVAASTACRMRATANSWTPSRRTTGCRRGQREPEPVNSCAEWLRE